MYENEFQTRLAQLREKKGVSARDMSLSIGQNPGYINNIETGKCFLRCLDFSISANIYSFLPRTFLTPMQRILKN